MSKSSTPAPQKMPEAIGLLGGGVIGGGWAARFILNGVDVRLYDPAPDAVERVQQSLERARRAFEQLTSVVLPREGSLTVVHSVAEAVRGVELVQENTPERLELKQQVLAEACRGAAPETLICSSTSGFRPSLLQADMPRPQRFVVSHPFHPVYLLPLVELCAGERTEPDTVERASDIYRAVGMHPLVVRNEIHGFIANRLQTAAWREALWLVHDGIASVDEIDDAVRYSFGLRLPVLGPMMTYFAGGGETNMRAFMKKWGPGNKDSSKLEAIPEYTDAFVNMLADQAEAQASAENMTVSQYQEILDEGVVAVLQGLRSHAFGPGETLARWEESVRNRTSVTLTTPRETELSGPPGGVIAQPQGRG